MATGLHSVTLVMVRAAAAALLWSLALGAAAQTVRYIHTDALGSVAVVTDQNRNVIERREYEPYGFQLTPAIKDGPGYTGHVQDAATGLTYMQQRYYDPSIGKMLSVDPVTAYGGGDWRQFNRYAYAFNNPYRFTDPDGRQSWSNTGTANSWPAVQQACGGSSSCEQEVAGNLAQAQAKIAATAYGGSTAAGALRALAGFFVRQGKSEQPNPSPGNSNPYDGPVDDPVTVVDSDGNAIPVGSGEQITSSPDGRYQQVRDSNGNPTGTRLDKGGHKTHADPKAQGPHGHRPGVTDGQGNPHLPLNEPKPPPPPPEPRL